MTIACMARCDMIRYLFEYFLISLDMPASGE